jgi:hypothetical protein
MPTAFEVEMSERREFPWDPRDHGIPKGMGIWINGNGNDSTGMGGNGNRWDSSR